MNTFSERPKYSPPWLVRSSLKEIEQPVIVNWDIGKLLSILVSQIIRISISFLMIFISKTDLFLIELILIYICLNMILEGFSILAPCKLEPRFCWPLWSKFLLVMFLLYIFLVSTCLSLTSSRIDFFPLVLLYHYLIL